MLRAALIALLLTTALPAQALLPPAQAKAFLDHFKRGRAHAAERRFEQAIAEYRLALALKPHPDVQWNIARAHEELEQYTDAITGFAAFLTMKKVTPREREEASARIAALRDRIARREATRIDVTVNVAEARVLIDGSEAGRGRHVTRTVAPGRHRVRIEAALHHPFERDADVELGLTTEIRADLVALPPPDAVLVVEADAPDARVEIPGRPATAPSQPITLSPGTVRVRVTAPGRPPFEQDVALGPGERRTLRVTLGPAPKTRDYPSWEGTYVALVAAPGERASRFARAVMTLDGARSPKGTLELARVEPLSQWRQRYCNHQRMLEWKGRYEVSVTFEDGVAELELENGAITECSCPTYCDLDDDDELTGVPLPGHAGFVGPEVAFVRQGEAAGASEAWIRRPAPDDVLGDWHVAPGWGPTWHQDLLVIAPAAGGLGAVFRRGLVGDVYSFHRAKCGDRATFQQVVAYAAPVAVIENGIALRFTSEEEVACSCPGACGAPPRMGTVELKLLHGAGYLLGDEVLFRRSEKAR